MRMDGENKVRGTLRGWDERSYDITEKVNSRNSQSVRSFLNVEENTVVHERLRRSIPAIPRVSGVSSMLKRTPLSMSAICWRGGGPSTWNDGMVEKWSTGYRNRNALTYCFSPPSAHHSSIPLFQYSSCGENPCVPV
jgi:hypothetical protein